MRPEAISDRIRLSYEARAARRSLIPEDSTIDTILSAVVDEASPHKQSVRSQGSEHNLFARPDELGTLAAIGVSIGAVMPLIHREAVFVAVFREPPERFIARARPCGCCDRKPSESS